MYPSLALLYKGSNSSLGPIQPFLLAPVNDLSLLHRLSGRSADERPDPGGQGDEATEELRLRPVPARGVHSVRRRPFQVTENRGPSD